MVLLLTHFYLDFSWSPSAICLRFEFGYEFKISTNENQISDAVVVRAGERENFFKFKNEL